ncbi:MAG: alanine racemase [Actinomycetota bacterium]
MRHRPTFVRVDLAAIRHNAAVLTPPGVRLMAVVKADAYGHGDTEVARAALDGGASWLGVALVEEGLGLRAAGIDAPILVLSEFPPGSETEALAGALTPSLYSTEGLARLAATATVGTAVHVKIDTGMHRVGVFPPEATAAFADEVAAAGLRIEGLWTHFARSEEDEITTREQLTLFHRAIDEVKAAGHVPDLLHAANSGAVILHPESHLDLVRPGIALVGVQPAPGVGASLGLRPALSWYSAVSFARRLPAGEALSYGHRYSLARDANVATVPVGYADGYPRALSSAADVLIRGRRCRVAGNVTMDQLLVDCGDLAVSAGDEVVLLGEQGAQAITAEELAGAAGTVGYEIVARIGRRVPREYTG